MKAYLPVLLAVTVFTTTAFSASPSPEGIAFFEQKIRPLLVEHCYECHSAEAKKLKGNLFLDSKTGWEKGGDSGEPVIIPGNIEASQLLKSVRHEDPDTAMPPKKPKLPDAAIADLIAWVKMGAPDPRDGTQVEAKRADKSWWSLQPLAREFRHKDIDGFLEEKLTEKGLHFNAPAEARALIRRMSYDLTGLPPSMEEVEAFAQAYRTEARPAVEALVDRLLASPQYGEHWGRHWLDVVRFGESNGFERNFIINDLWPFRDYVIHSFNEDKPFNRFIAEHLAGDILGKGNPEVEVGSAFLVAGPYDDVGNQDVVAQKNIRAATLDELVTSTSSAFLGLTVNCARCHNHKFDPIPTEDYYRLKSAFEGVKHGRRVVVSKQERAAFDMASKPLNDEKKLLTEQQQALEKAVEARCKAAAAAQKTARPKVDPNATEDRFPAEQVRFVKFVMHASTANPKSANGARLTEFEVWSADTASRNVALAANGGSASGTQSIKAEDFPEAYGPQLCIDGKPGEQWAVGTPAELTITLAKLETVDRIVFSNAKGKDVQDKSQGATPCEYEVSVSVDGTNWKTVTSGLDRAPWSEAHGIERVRREVTTEAERVQLAALAKSIAELQRKIDAVPKLREIWAGTYSQPSEQTFVHKGGDPLKPGDSVVPASLSVLDRVGKPFALPADAPEGERRLALANWLTGDDNPLPPRVLANRLWHYHFGTGLVDTPGDFGFLGSRPSHPELLDFLATRLLFHGWRLKPLHREIMLSRAYQQSADPREEAARVDKSARLLWRFPPRRLGAEEIRDTVLSAAGKLQLVPAGGPGFRLYKVLANNVSTYVPLEQHGPETYRRAVYHQNARASVVDLLSDFDLPDTAFPAPKRANTSTPLQALTLLNHGFTLDMAAALATRLGSNHSVQAAYRIAFQREPSPAEKDAADRFIAEHGLTAFCRALLNASELVFLD